MGRVKEREMSNVTIEQLRAALTESEEARRSWWRIEGQLHFAGGFSLVVSARDKEEAERLGRTEIKERAEKYDPNHDVSEDFGIGLNEVCITTVTKEGE